MQTTYLKQTASSILKTARIKRMAAGNVEVVVTVPKMGDCLAKVWGRGDGWGGVIQDVLGLENAAGSFLRLATSPASLLKLEGLASQAEAMQLADLRRDGHIS